MPADHMFPGIDRFVDLEGFSAPVAVLQPSWPCLERSKLLIWMLIGAYCFGIRSERRACEGGVLASLLADSTGSDGRRVELEQRPATMVKFQHGRGEYDGHSRGWRPPTP